METFSITFKTPANTKPIKTDVKAYHLKEAIQKLKKKYQNIFVVSYMQI